jgi:hypothetical protein
MAIFCGIIFVEVTAAKVCKPCLPAVMTSNQPDRTMRTLHTLLLPMLMVLLLASCASTQNTTAVRDDVYFMPGDEPVTAARPKPVPSPEDEARMQPVQPGEQGTDDYYDPEVANEEARRGYYDMAYNDPFFYNYGRFGFGTQLGWTNGWNGPGWGGGMGLGWNNGFGWNDPWMNGMGWHRPGNGMWMGWNNGWGWNDPWMQPGMGWGGSMFNQWGGMGMGMGMGPGMGWNSPWGWNSPMGMGWNRPWGMDPWGNGPYAGPFGGCWSCYSPIVIGGGSQTVVRPRSGLAGGPRGTSASQPRVVSRDPAGLRPSSRPTPVYREAPRATGVQTRPGAVREPGNRNSPVLQRESGGQRTAPTRNTPTRTAPRTTPPQREAPSRIGGGGSFGGGSAAPSRNGGGGGGSRNGGSRPR